MSFRASPPDLSICKCRHLRWQQGQVSVRPLLCQFRTNALQIVESWKNDVMGAIRAPCASDSVSHARSPLMATSSVPQDLLMRSRSNLCWFKWSVLLRPFSSEHGIQRFEVIYSRNDSRIGTYRALFPCRPCFCAGLPLMAARSNPPIQFIGTISNIIRRQRVISRGPLRYKLRVFACNAVYHIDLSTSYIYNVV